MSDPLMLFVDDERPAPADWILAKTAAEAVDILESFHKMGTLFDVVSLDYDLGVAGGNTEPVLKYFATYKAWPTELYVHTANQDAEELLLAIIAETAPKGTLKGYGCNYWGTGPDSVVQNHVMPPVGPYPFTDQNNMLGGPVGVNEQPKPTPNNQPSVHDLIVTDGRDHMRDAYEEALDLAAYMRAHIAERDERLRRGRSLMMELQAGRALDALFVEELFAAAFK
jgi:hypothetical protein